MPSFLRLMLTNTAAASFAVLVAATYMDRPRPEKLIWSFIISWVYATSIGALAWWIMPKMAPRIRGEGLWKWARLQALLTAIGLTGGTISYLILAYQPFLNLHINYRASMTTCILLTLGIGTITYIIEAARHRIQATTLELRTRELERERALKAASEAKLQSLESRIHPHFLFNTLNSISSLVRTDPAQAEELIDRLAKLLRFSLDRHGSLVKLSDEIKIATDYLEIEKARFGDRLRFTFDVAPALYATDVPALSLQTLIENSVKYAVGAQRQGADIHIRAFREGASLRFEVSDSGPGFSPESLPQGHGLDSLKQRLEALFGDKALLTARRLDPGMEVAFRIPC